MGTGDISRHSFRRGGATWAQEISAVTVSVEGAHMGTVDISSHSFRRGGATWAQEISAVTVSVEGAPHGHRRYQQSQFP